MYKIKQTKPSEKETILISKTNFFDITNSKGEVMPLQVLTTYTDYGNNSGNYEIDTYYLDENETELKTTELEAFIGEDEDVDIFLEDIQTEIAL